MGSASRPTSSSSACGSRSSRRSSTTASRGREASPTRSATTGTSRPASSQFTPALRIEEFFGNLFGLAADGKTDAKGRPAVVQTAALLREFPDEFFYLANVPVRVQRAIGAALAALRSGAATWGPNPRYTWSRSAA